MPDIRACKRQRVTQVLDRGEIVLEAIGVAEERQVAPVVLPQRDNPAVVPEYFARLHRGQAGEHSQQAGLATAVFSADAQRLPGFQSERQIMEQAPVAAGAFDLTGLKHYFRDDRIPG